MQTETASSVARLKSFAAYPRMPVGSPIPPDWKKVRCLSEPIDALVITTRNIPDRDIESLVRKIDNPFLPVISLVEDDRPILDSVTCNGAWEAWERAHEILTRMQDLPSSARESRSPENILLARLYARDVPLEPVYGPARSEGVWYPAAGLLPDVTAIADRLVASGHLERQFFDRLHVCPNCNGSRLSVREECHSCRSPHLVQQPILHHFRCGHEAGQRSFCTGGRFECPKCGDLLRHIGLDYDKPGSMLICEQCGRCDDAVAVGFLCLDCARHFDAAQVPTRDWYSYRATAKGIRCLLEDSAKENTSRGDSRLFQFILDYVAKERNTFGDPYKIIHLRFTEAEKIRASDVRLWGQLQQLVHDGLHSVLRDVDAVTDVRDDLLILLPRATEKQAIATMSQIRWRLLQILRIDPGIQCEVLPQSEVKRLLESR